MPQFLLDLAIKLTNSIFYMFRDLMLWIFEQILYLSSTLIYALPAPDFSALNPGTYLAGLPATVTNMWHYLHVDQALALVIGALVIRLLLQLIPFTRLGS